MAKMTITIYGNEIEMQPIKARLWRKIMTPTENNNKITAIDALDRYCEIIAVAFGVTVDDVLDNLNADDVMPKYLEVLKEFSGMLTSKLSNKKNESSEEN